MKKSLLALAVFGAFAGAASAQTAASTSSVTLYGIFDTGVGYQKGTKLASPTAKENLVTLDSGVQSGSRWGFRGSEDLGSGLKAIFNLEGGINTDQGTTAQSVGNANRLFGRWAYAGLAGNFGEIRLGRQWSAGFEYFGNIDVFGLGFKDAGTQRAFSSANGLRLDNMIAYRTPTVSGFQGMVGYSINPGLTNTAAGGIQGEVPGLANNPHVTTIGTQYATGPFLGVLTYERVHCPGNVTVALGPNCGPTVHDAQTHFQAGATWDFGFAKAHLAYGKEKKQFIGGTVTNSPDSQSYLVGATIPLVGGNLLFQAQRRDDKSAAVTTTVAGVTTVTGNADLNVFALGYTYPLSRRTNLYTFVSDARAKNAQNTVQSYQDLSRRQAEIGLRHLF